MGRSPTINVRHIDRLVVEGRTSAANDGHPREGMSSAEQPTSLPSTMSQFSASDIFRDSYALAKGGRTEGPSGSGGRSRSGSRRDVAGSARRPFRRTFFSRQQRPQEEPIASAFPSVMRGPKPNPFGQQRLRSTNFPFGQSRIPREANSPPFAVLRCAPALRVQSARAGLFCAAPRGTRWRWASGPRRKKGSPKWLPTAPSPPPSVRPARP
jgi:hypothetical protein